MAKLIRIRTYAKIKNLTTAAIYKQIKNGKLKAVTIDTVKFIEV